jgi:hypothetical protein
MNKASGFLAIGIRLCMLPDLIRNKKEFLREILKEVRVRGNAVRLTYRLPMTVRTPPSEGADPRTGEFFTLYQMVEAVRQCKELLLSSSFTLK